MKSIFYIVLIPLLLVCGVFSVKAQGTTSRGTEFWTAYMLHVSGTSGSRPSNMSVYITSDVSTSGTVSVADGSFSQNFTVMANQVTTVDIPASTYLDNMGAFLKGIHITALKPIAVYAHIYAMSVSGATLLLPVSAMGKDYMSINYTQQSNEQVPTYSTFAVIATEDSTTVSIKPTATLYDGHPQGVAFNVVLHKGEVYQALSQTDLTGTIIKSVSSSLGVCKKIAVFSGSSKIGIGCKTQNNLNFSSDNLFQQVYPTAAWGKKYITAALAQRNIDIYRIVLSDPNTHVTLNGAAISPTSYINGLYYEFTSGSSNIIEANKPVQVVQYTASQNQSGSLNCTTQSEAYGDPEMIYLSPIEQGLTRVTLYSTSQFRIQQSFINVIIPDGGISSFTLDETPFTGFYAAAGNGYSYAQIPVGAGTHTINADVPFNAIAYGFGAAESYGYAAGTNLQDLNNFLAFQDPQKPDTTISTACQDIDYKLQLTLSYQTTKISWELGNGIAPYVDNNPVIKRTMVRAGKTLYVYEYPYKVVYPPGTTNDAIAKVTNPIADECGSTEDFVFTFIVNELPKPKIGLDSVLCEGSPIVFKDATVHASGAVSKKWLWDFGDNTTATEKDPVHNYAAAGSYYARLTVTDDNGCTAISDSVLVYIAKRPLSGFTVAAPTCVTRNIIFASTATAPEGVISSWIWDFGDGTIRKLTAGAPVTHAYADTGRYNIKLTVLTNLGCIATATQFIHVNPLPVVSFTTPQICENDYLNNVAGVFTPAVTIADNTENELTYQWDFGDPGGIDPNTSGQKIGSHKYNRAGNYTVMLRVTSKYGCDTMITKTFTVSSAPQPEFTFKNDCSSRDIVFKDVSKIQTGSINKIIWCFDYANHPEITETVTNFSVNGEYTHNYGAFTGTTQARQYVVRMVAYSGQSVVCSAIATHTVTVYPEPVVTIKYNNISIADSITVCEADPSFRIIEDKGIYTGNGEFAGSGISRAGTFSPQSAGPGLFPIIYTFTTAPDGCPVVKAFYIRVNPTPRVSLAPTVTILSGDNVTLNANATVSSGGLSYTWSPSTGLNHINVLKPVASPLTDITYTLIVSTGKGCPAEPVQIAVKVLQPPVIPNTFTPNADGINDNWQITNLDTYPGATVEVFNRYGERIFSSVGYPVPWDGTFKGNQLPSGTYYYIVAPKNGRKAVSGPITIIR